jgi:hypothetical protein
METREGVMAPSTVAPSHERGRRAHTTLRCTAFIAVVGACGPSDQPASPGWAYGGAERPVVSWPVMDEDGNLFVLVGEEAQVSGVPANEVLVLDAVSLVNLDPDGTERWSVEISAAMTIAHEAPVRPIVGPGGDVWVHVGEVLTRVSADGEVSWRLQSLPDPDGYSGGFALRTSLHAALDVSGVYYALPRIQIDDNEQKQQLRAIGPDGTELWAFDPATPGYSGFKLSPVPSQTVAPIVDPSGRVMLGCDLCGDLSIGIARFDRDSGQPTMLFSVPGAAPAQFQQLLWDGSAMWAELTATGQWGVWTVTPSGTTTQPEYAIQLVAESGAVWMDPELAWGAPSFSLHWGDDTIDVTRSPALVPGEIVGATPVAVVEPQAVLLAVHVRIPPGIVGTDDGGLLLVDRAGMVSWYQGGMFYGRQPVPAIGDGFIAYIEAETQRLVSVEAPVERVADGAWPIVGGDPQGTRSAEGK